MLILLPDACRQSRTDVLITVFDDLYKAKLALN